MGERQVDRRRRRRFWPAVGTALFAAVMAGCMLAAMLAPNDIIHVVVAIGTWGFQGALLLGAVMMDRFVFAPLGLAEIPAYAVALFLGCWAWAWFQLLVVSFLWALIRR